jgi:hypothetical protein
MFHNWSVILWETIQEEMSSKKRQCSYNIDSTSDRWEALDVLGAAREK